MLQVGASGYPYLRQQGGSRQGWGSAVLRAPSSGTQTQVSAGSQRQAWEGGMGRWVGGGGRRQQTQPVGYTPLLFLPSSGIYTEQRTSCIELVASNEMLLIFRVPN